MSDRAEPFTALDLFHWLGNQIAHDSTLKDAKVHLLDMSDRDNNGGFATHAELDIFDEEEGVVVSLISWPDKPEQKLSGSNNTVIWETDDVDWSNVQGAAISTPDGWIMIQSSNKQEEDR